VDIAKEGFRILIAALVGLAIYGTFKILANRSKTAT
jgi:hypothetical protein